MLRVGEPIGRNEGDLCFTSLVQVAAKSDTTFATTAREVCAGCPVEKH
jgi:hypothetical protein